MVISHHHHLYAGVFVDSTLLPRELEGVLDALLAARATLAETRCARHVVLDLEEAKSSAHLGKWVDSSGGICLPQSRKAQVAYGRAC